MGAIRDVTEILSTFHRKHEAAYSCSPQSLRLQFSFHLLFLALPMTTDFHFGVCVEPLTSRCVPQPLRLPLEERRRKDEAMASKLASALRSLMSGACSQHWVIVPCAKAQLRSAESEVIGLGERSGVCVETSAEMATTEREFCPRGTKKTLRAENMDRVTCLRVMGERRNGGASCIVTAHLSGSMSKVWQTYHCY